MGKPDDDTLGTEYVRKDLTIAFAAFCLERQQNPFKWVPYQTCPICMGSGVIWNPHAGVTNPTLTCPSCQGVRIIPQHIIEP